MTRRRTAHSRSLRPAGVVAGALTLLAVLAVAAASCGGAAPSPNPSASPPRQESGIRGIVLFGGGPHIASPSPLPGGFGSGHQGRPYPGVAVEVSIGRGTQKGRVIATVKPDADALFTIAVPPGVYVLRPLVGHGAAHTLSVTVVVRPGRFVRALVYAVIAA